MIKIFISPEVYAFRNPDSLDVTPVLIFADDGRNMTLAKIKMDGKEYEITTYNNKLKLEEKKDALRLEEEKKT